MLHGEPIKRVYDSITRRQTAREPINRSGVSINAAAEPFIPAGDSIK